MLIQDLEEDEDDEDDELEEEEIRFKKNKDETIWY